MFMGLPRSAFSAHATMGACKALARQHKKRSLFKARKLLMV
jgi:hypothetical protein